MLLLSDALPPLAIGRFDDGLSVQVGGIVRPPHFATLAEPLLRSLHASPRALTSSSSRLQCRLHRAPRIHQRVDEPLPGLWRQPGIAASPKPSSDDDIAAIRSAYRRQARPFVRICQGRRPAIEARHGTVAGQRIMLRLPPARVPSSLHRRPRPARPPRLAPIAVPIRRAAAPPRGKFRTAPQRPARIARGPGGA